MSAVAGWVRIVLDERPIRPGGAVSNETAHTNQGNLQH
jgi:hypothetical protein